jgi:hypothetical protein
VKSSEILIRIGEFGVRKSEKMAFFLSVERFIPMA